MKQKTQMQKTNLMKFVKVAALCLILIAAELVLGITLCGRVIAFSEEGVKNGQAEEVRRAVIRFDETILNGADAVPDFTGSISGETEITIDGRNYTAVGNIGRNLKNNGINFYSLYEICDNSSADEFILSDNKIYVVYGFADGDNVNLRFKNLADVTEGFSVGGFDGLVVFSGSKRAVFALNGGNGATDVFEASGFSYSPEFSENGVSLQTVEVEGVTYSFAYIKSESTGYFVGGYKDYTSAADRIAAFKRAFMAAFSFIGILTVFFVFVGVYVIDADRLRLNKIYNFTTDVSGNVISADENFKRDFPEVKTVREKLNRFEEDGVYAIKLPAANEEKTLACVVDKSFDGAIRVSARELRVPFGTEIDTEEKGAMKTVYESLADSSQVLVGRIYFANMEEIRNVFGEDFADEVRTVLIERTKKIFPFVFRFDDYYLGVIHRQGRALAHFLKDASKRLSELKKPIKIGANNIIVKVKSGFALSDFTMKTREYEYVASAAGAALKRAIEEKSENSTLNDFFIFREAQKKAYSKYMFVVDIPGMLKNGDFYLEYQPQYSFKEKKIVGFEALFRVNKRVKMNIDTPDIIAYAEHSGEIVMLGDFIMNEGMKFAKSIEKYGITVSLNVSLIQLMQTGFVDNFLKIYRNYDLKPNAIALEITESYFMRSIDETTRKLRILHENGITIHLDDFGTQYSSFGYLKSLPISAIKIDKSFVSDIDKNKYSKIITETIFDLSEKLNYGSICEGVESVEQLDVVRSLGCEVIQGFIISRPVGEEKAREMIENYSYEYEKKDETEVNDHYEL